MDPKIAKQITHIARDLSSLNHRIRAMELTAQGRFRSISGGDTKYYDDFGNLRVILGSQDDGTYTHVEVNGNPPPKPSAPVLTPRPGALIIAWDGLTADDSPLPLDWSHVEVHISTTPAYTPTDLTQIHVFTSSRGGAVTFSLDVAPYYVKFVAVSNSSVESDPSDEITATPLAPLSDGLAPSASPVPELIPAMGAIIVSWDEVDNQDTVTYDVYVASVVGVPITSANLAGSVAGTVLFVRTLPATGDPLAVGTTYYVKVVARDIDGAASPSVAVAGQVSSTLDDLLGITQTNITDDMMESPIMRAGIVETVVLNADTITADVAWIDALTAITFTGTLIQTHDDLTTGVKMGADFPGSPGGGIIGYDDDGEESFRVDASTGLLSARDVTLDGVFRSSRDGPRVEIWDAFYAPKGQTWGMINFWNGELDWRPGQILGLFQEGDPLADPPRPDYGYLQITAPLTVDDMGAPATLVLQTDTDGTDRKATILADQVELVAETFYLGTPDSTSIDFHPIGTSQFQFFSDAADWSTGYLNISLGGTDRHVIAARNALGGDKDLRLKGDGISFDDAVTGVVTLRSIINRLDALEA